MQTTIAIRDIFVSEGTTKKGQPFRLTKLYSTERRYYSTFKADLPKLQDVQKGSAVTLEYSDGDRPNTFSIIKILKVENRQSLAEQGRLPPKSTQPVQVPIKVSEATVMAIEQRIDLTKDIIARKFGIRKEEITPSMELVAEILAQMRSIEWQNKS